MNTPNQNSKGILNQGTGKAKGIRKKAERKEIMGGCGSPFATLFITVLRSDVNPKALIIQRVIKEHAVPAGRKRRQIRFPSYSTQCGCRKSSRELVASCVARLSQVQPVPFIR